MFISWLQEVLSFCFTLTYGFYIAPYGFYITPYGFYITPTGVINASNTYPMLCVSLEIYFV